MVKIKTCGTCMYYDEICGITGMSRRENKDKCRQWKLKHKVDSAKEAKIERLGTRAYIIFMTKKDSLDAEGKPLNCGKCESVNPTWRKAPKTMQLFKCMNKGRDIENYMIGNKRHPECDIEPLSAYFEPLLKKKKSDKPKK